MRVGRRYVVSGRVQGVGFRAFTQTAAVREGVRGWVENRPDGSVAIGAEAEPEALDRFERHIRRGPPGARVDHVDAAAVAVDERNIHFTIR